MLAGMVLPAYTQLTVAGASTENPTVLYKGEPMLKIGPLPEVVPFAVEWGSSRFPHQRWLDWMAKNGLGYGRVYPESGWPWEEWDVDRRVIPFKTVRREGGEPIVDITKYNPAYWDNFARVIRECAGRGIILQMQLYQRVFFANRAGPQHWENNYFNPANNVNGFPAPPGAAGYGLWPAMVTDRRWREVHRQWVNHVLEGIGSNGNVVIDLINEGSFQSGNTRAWIEYTLEIIEAWERKTGNNLLVGMDFDHMYKKKDAGLEYVLAHPKLDLIICEGSEGHVVAELTAGTRKPLAEPLAAEYRKKYRKPVISTNSPGYSVHENPEVLRLYQWYSMMVKVQGVGVYAKTYPVNFDSEPVRTYARESRILLDFFGKINDYAALDLASDKIAAAPGRYKLALVSPAEAVVYLYAGGFAEQVPALQRLSLSGLPWRDGEARLELVSPVTGAAQSRDVQVRGGTIECRLPAFTGDLAIHAVRREPTPVSRKAEPPEPPAAKSGLKVRR